jgi:hypothetical protein
MKLKKKVEDWYRGKYIPPPPNDPDSPIIFVSAGWYEQPHLARMIGAIARFWLAHWQWIMVLP